MYVFGGDMRVQWVWGWQRFKILGGGSSRVATYKKFGKVGTVQKAFPKGLHEYWGGGEGRSGRESSSILPTEIYEVEIP